MEQKRCKFGNWMRNSFTARMLVVGFLLLVLLIPLEFVKSLINERAYRQQEVVQEINNKWGKEVLLSGPIVKIPYSDISEEKIFNEKTKSYYSKTNETQKNAYFFPEKLDITSAMETKPLNRSIYESVVGFKFPLLICTSLASLYGFIFVIIQLENHALLVGSIGLIVILAIVMFASRRIDWNNE
ncbi:inner membrane CreD family protein [Aequorivita sp. SDUM287046]|uniref:Inner membrane CreD family protein n=1 Tax=Aequorivita aurantiaca TaxID=3053356 RepID=A0ABT8DPQ4_9FLAO|nr:inner membrane CreD family protein [Aequorivita aurantiaca]MDN3725195.1 inner membrane CreD family protein [Aequorivita aurantiaca]